MLRHSTAHVLAQAVQDIFPEAKLGIGPPIENGFYYDFGVAKPFQPEDLDKLEKRMQEIIKSGPAVPPAPLRLAWTRPRPSWPTSRSSWSWSTSRARRWTPTEVMEVGGGELTIYDNLDAKEGKRLLGRPVPGPAPADAPG